MFDVNILSELFYTIVSYRSYMFLPDSGMYLNITSQILLW